MLSDAGRWDREPKTLELKQFQIMIKPISEAWSLKREA